MKVYTYYRVITDIPRYAKKSELELLNFWRESWKKHGWRPIVLSEDFARQHPLFDDWSKLLLALPRRPEEIHWQMSCLYRWIALARVGGGMMVDYDVINYGFRPENISPDNDNMVLFADDPPGLFMGAVWGSKKRYEEMIALFTQQKPEATLNVGDLKLIARIYKALEWFRVVPGCSNYSWPDWNKSPMVHYHSGHRREQKNQTEWIKSLRPI